MYFIIPLSSKWQKHTAGEKMHVGIYSINRLGRIFNFLTLTVGTKGGFALSRNFYVRTDVNFNWLYVRKLK